MIPLLVDTSAVLAVLLNEPSRPALIRATDGHQLVGAPSLPWEVGNALIAGFRRKRLSAADVRKAWGSYVTIPVRLADVNGDRALQIAMEMGVYAYDAYVLETARAEGLVVVTLDRQLAAAGQRLGLEVREFKA